MRFLLAVLVVALFAPAAARACSMCQCGDPTYRMMGDDFFAAQAWRFSVNVDRRSKDQVSEDDPAAREKETENRVTLSGSWQPFARLRLVGRVPLAERRIDDPAGRATLSGISDPDVFAHVNLLESGNAASGWWLAAMLGVKTAWGQNERTVGGVRAEEHLQPGSGATSTFAGLAWAHGIGGAAHVYASATGRWNGANDHGYTYGDALLATLSYQRALAPSLSGSLELDYRASAHDRVNGVRDPNTGGSLLYASPKVQIALAAPIGLQLGAQIPVAPNLYGDQREFANFESGLVLSF